MALHRWTPSPRRFTLALLIASGLAVSAFGPVFAHPLGNFTINRYSSLQAGTNILYARYIVDMAEIPAHAERALIDVDGDGQLSAPELDAYRTTKSMALAQQLALMVNGARVPLQVATSQLSFPAGQAGLPTLRLEIQLSAGLAQGEPFQAEYRDGTYTDRIGWQEIVVNAQPGAHLTRSNVATQDVSHALTVYPQDLLSNPLHINTATFAFAAGAAATAMGATIEQAPAGMPTAPVTPKNGRPSDPFTELVTIPEMSLWAVLVAMVAAMGWGAVHAMSPGHGKTIVAAYLVGARGTARHALFLGLTTTITHTAGVFALGIATLALSRFILPETLYPWLSSASGVLVVLIGLSLVRDRLATKRRQQPDPVGHDHAHPHSHEDGHTHGHSHDGVWHTHDDQAHSHSHALTRSPAHTHSHLPPNADGRPLTWRSLLVLGVSGGLLPCPSALVLMLGAISLNRAGFGLLLIVAFSLGLAGVLTLSGILLLHAGKFFERIPESGRILRLAPVGSALFITAAGLIITVQALAQTGLWKS